MYVWVASEWWRRWRWAKRATQTQKQKPKEKRPSVTEIQKRNTNCRQKSNSECANDKIIIHRYLRATVVSSAQNPEPCIMTQRNRKTLRTTFAHDLFLPHVEYLHHRSFFFRLLLLLPLLYATLISAASYATSDAIEWKKRDLSIMREFWKLCPMFTFISMQTKSKQSFGAPKVRANPMNLSEWRHHDNIFSQILS